MSEYRDEEDMDEENSGAEGSFEDQDGSTNSSALEDGATQSGNASPMLDSSPTEVPLEETEVCLDTAFNWFSSGSQGSTNAQGQFNQELVDRLAELLVCKPEEIFAEVEKLRFAFVTQPLYIVYRWCYSFQSHE